MIVIVAPHACLLSLPWKDLIDSGCDQNSHKYAKILHSEIPSKILISRTLRSICDNNRIECRNTYMRKRLRQLFLTGQIFIILEIHTFLNSRSFKLSTNPEMVILKTLSKHSRLLYKYLIQHNIKTEFLRGSFLNDIQLEANEYNVDAILLEFRLDLDNERVKEIAQIILEYLQDYGTGIYRRSSYNN